MSGRSLVERVVAERQRRGLTIRQAAALTDITNTTWSRWENEAGAPSPKMRTAVADAFGWEPDWPENPPPLPMPTDHGLTLADLRADLVALREGQLGVVAELHTTIAEATERVAAALERLERQIQQAGRSGRAVSPRR